MYIYVCVCVLIFISVISLSRFSLLSLSLWINPKPNVKTNNEGLTSSHTSLTSPYPPLLLQRRIVEILKVTLYNRQPGRLCEKCHFVLFAPASRHNTFNEDWICLSAIVIKFRDAHRIASTILICFISGILDSCGYGTCILDYV